MKKLGSYLREQRRRRGLLLREVASHLGLDTPLLSKIERGQRTLKRDKLPTIAQLFQVNVDVLSTLWLADRVYETLKDEPLGPEALRLAEEEMIYHRDPKTNK